MKKTCHGHTLGFAKDGSGPFPTPCTHAGTLIPVLSVREASGAWRDFPLTNTYCPACASDTSVDDLVGEIEPPYLNPSQLWRVIQLYFENKQLGTPTRAGVTLRWITSKQFQEHLMGSPSPMTAVGYDAPNVGHGHVYPRPDGAVARCGGPAICAECAKDAEQKKQADLAKNKAYEINQRLAQQVPAGNPVIDAANQFNAELDKKGILAQDERVEPPVTGWSGGMAGVGANAEKPTTLADYSLPPPEAGDWDEDEAQEAHPLDPGRLAGWHPNCAYIAQPGTICDKCGAAVPNLADPNDAAVFGSAAMRLEHDDAEGVKATPLAPGELERDIADLELLSAEAQARIKATSLEPIPNAIKDLVGEGETP